MIHPGEFNIQVLQLNELDFYFRSQGLPKSSYFSSLLKEEKTNWRRDMFKRYSVLKSYRAPRGSFAFVFMVLSELLKEDEQNHIHAAILINIRTEQLKVTNCTCVSVETKCFAMFQKQ